MALLDFLGALVRGGQLIELNGSILEPL